MFLNIVESKKNNNQEFERFSIIVFEEDLDAFLDGFKKAVKFIRER